MNFLREKNCHRKKCRSTFLLKIVSTDADTDADIWCRSIYQKNSRIHTEHFPAVLPRRLLVERAPDGLRLDRDHVGGERDEVVAGGPDGHVTRGRVHHLPGVDVARGAKDGHSSVTQLTTSSDQYFFAIDRLS